MQQTKDESRFIPLSAYHGNMRAWDKVRLSYSLFSSLPTAHAQRMRLCREEGQGFRNAKSITHNKARFPSKKLLLPPRERTHQENAKNAQRDEKRQKAIIALKYGRRYNTATMATIERAKDAKISIQPRNDIQSFAEARDELNKLLTEDRIGEDALLSPQMSLGSKPNNSTAQTSCSGMKGKKPRPSIKD